MKFNDVSHDLIYQESIRQYLQIVATGRKRIVYVTFVERWFRRLQKIVRESSI